MLLTIRSLTKTFPGTLALDEVDFDLRAGEVHALLGENGAGKSTLIKCLTGAYRRDGGTVTLDVGGDKVGIVSALAMDTPETSSPGDKVIVEGPTFLATIQCFRLYGAEVISAPIDSQGVIVDELEKLIAEHQPKLVYLIPTFGNPSGATLSLERRQRVLELAVKYQTLVVEDDPIISLYFEDTILGFGARTVRTAANVARALELIAERAPDFALLDVGLVRGEKTFVIAERLDALKVPFAFITGYGADIRLPESLADKPRLAKPCSSETLEAALRNEL